MVPDGSVLVSICLCTYRRTHLKATLESLAAQDLPTGVSIEVVVADNDSQGSGKPIVDAFAAAVPFPVGYRIEPRKGVSHARNRTLAMAKGDWLAFLDDDEMAEPTWIHSHLETAKRLGADVLVGRVRPRYETAPPSWVVRSGLYEHERRLGPTGSRDKLDFLFRRRLPGFYGQEI